MRRSSVFSKLTEQTFKTMIIMSWLSNRASYCRTLRAWAFLQSAPWAPLSSRGAKGVEDLQEQATRAAAVKQQAEQYRARMTATERHSRLAEAVDDAAAAPVHLAPPPPVGIEFVVEQRIKEAVSRCVCVRAGDDVMDVGERIYLTPTRAQRRTRQPRGKGQTAQARPPQRLVVWPRRRAGRAEPHAQDGGV